MQVAATNGERERRRPSLPERTRAVWVAVLAALLVGGPLCAPVRAGQYRVDWRAQLSQWRYPAGMVVLDPATGAISLAEYRGRYNAVLDAPAHTHVLADRTVRAGGVHADKVGSRGATGPLVADGHTDTYWQPDPADPLDRWWLEVDLGRATVVTDVRLVFPDRAGARPFSEFTLFGSEGRRTGSRQDVHFFHSIGGTTRPNTDTVVVYNVRPAVKELVRALADTAAVPLPEIEQSYDVLQYIRFVADSQTPEAALAEIQVFTPGENIALGTLDRLGSIVDVKQPGAKPEPGTMADGTMNEMWGTALAGAVWEWDLGGLFWVRQIIMRASEWEQRVRWYASLYVQIMPHSLRVSDGARTLTGEIDYDVLFESDQQAFGTTQTNMPLQVDYRLAPRRIRYVQADWEGYGQTGWIGETIVIPAGHAAEVTMVSDLIDLTQVSGGTASKIIQSLAWETEPLPPGAYVQARTRSGRTVVDSVLYFHKDGRQITEDLYRRLPASLQGETQRFQVPGPDWSGWSNWYTIPGASFLSPSPRRYVQLMLVLGSRRHDTTPVVHAVTLDYSDAVLADVAAELAPREVEPGVDTTFTLTLTPSSGSATERFDHILVRTPSQVTSAGVELRVDGAVQAADAYSVVTRAPDSLIVRHAALRNESVQLRFRARVLGNATQVLAYVGHSGTASLPALWQPVSPAAPYATTVLVPSVPRSARRVANLRVPAAFSPNGDGVNDEAVIAFALLRAELVPAAAVPELAQVRVYDAAGRRVADLAGELQGNLELHYRWSGRDTRGQLVPPGNYLCQITVQTDAGDETATRLIGVAY